MEKLFLEVNDNINNLDKKKNPECIEYKTKTAVCKCLHFLGWWRERMPGENSRPSTSKVTNLITLGSAGVVNEPRQMKGALTTRPSRSGYTPRGL